MPSSFNSVFLLTRERTDSGLIPWLLYQVFKSKSGKMNKNNNGIFCMVINMVPLRYPRQSASWNSLTWCGESSSPVTDWFWQQWVFEYINVDQTLRIIWCFKTSFQGHRNLELPLYCQIFNYVTIKRYSYVEYFT